jgi:hypothetical protein
MNFQRSSEGAGGGAEGGKFMAQQIERRNLVICPATSKRPGKTIPPYRRKAANY